MTSKTSNAHPTYGDDDYPSRFGDWVTRADIYGYPERPNVRRPPLGGYRTA